MKLEGLTKYASNYETSFEILPKTSTPIIVVGKAKGIRNIDNEMVLDEVKKIKGTNKEKIDGKTYPFCLYKAGFKAFLDNSFIYYEHYIADYNLSSDEILKRLQAKKKLTEEHLTDILSGLNKEVLVKMTLLSLFKLNQTKQQEIERILIEGGGDIIQNRQTLRDSRCADFYNRINFNILLYNKDICVTTLCDWKNCRSGITSFIHSVKGELPNPHIDNEKKLVEKAYDNFLQRCNIVSVEVLREQNKTILEKILWPSAFFLIPLMVLTLYVGLNTKNILGMSSALGVYVLIVVTLLWFWQSLKN